MDEVCWANESGLVAQDDSVGFAVPVNGIYASCSHFLLPLLFLGVLVVKDVVGRVSGRVFAKSRDGVLEQDEVVPDAEVAVEVSWERYVPKGSKSCLCFKFSPPKPVDALNYEEMKKILQYSSKGSQESESDYDLGGYMPVSPDDILQDSYKVCRKLGFGHFSTVWLCENMTSNGKPKFVAMKISKSDELFAAVARDEIKLLEETRSTDPSHPGYLNIVQMVDTFKVASCNGLHTVIALEIMGPSLLDLLIQSEYRGIQIPGVRKIIQQVLIGLTYLHEVCHIIHTDIKPENVLIKVNESYIKDMAEKASQFSKLGLQMPRSYVGASDWNGTTPDKSVDIGKKLEEKRSKSYPFDVFLADLCNFRERHAEPQLTAPMWINSNIEIKIADLGNACWDYRHFASEIQTRQYRALEVILGAGYSFPADIWSVGCMAFEMATGEILFGPKGRNHREVNLDHLSLIWETLAGIPRYITEAGTEAKRFFKDGKLRYVAEDDLKVWKIEDVLVEKYNWKRVDAIPFAGFVEALIEPDPALRVTATNALLHQWMSDT